MRDSLDHIPGYRVAFITLDHRAVGSVTRALPALEEDFPGLHVSVHAAGTWNEDPAALEEARMAVASANIVVVNLLFIEDQVEAIYADLVARRPHLDALIGVVADEKLVNLTKMGDLDLSVPASGALKYLKKLKPSSKGKKKVKSGEGQMRILRRLPKVLKYLPGKAQDLRAYFLSMQYWLSGSDDNVREMVRFLVNRYSGDRFAAVKAELPQDYPEVGLYHPSTGIVTDIAELPAVETPVATIGVLMLRSYILSNDAAHYDAVIDALEAKGVRVIPAFAGGLDGRPAIDRYFHGIDAMISLTGFSLVGGPAYNDADAAVEALKALDIPYLAAHPLEFQTLDQWATSSQGLRSG